MEELDIITDVVDEGFLVDGQIVSIEDTVNGESHKVMEMVRATGDFTPVWDAVRSLNSLMRAGGWTSAKILHDAMTEWIIMGLDPNHFYDQAVEGTGYKKIVVERYIRAWQGHLQLPPEYAAKMLTQPIKNGIALGNAVAQGYEPDEEQIEKLVESKSNSEFLANVRELTGREPRKNSLTIYIDEKGDIQAWQDGKVAFVGYLALDKRADPLIDKSIERIIKSSGMIER